MFWKNWCWHKFGPTSRSDGRISKQYEMCGKCGKRRKKYCSHEWGENYTHYPTTLQKEEDGEINLSFTIKECRKCLNCDLIEVVYSYQW